ncbi:DUF5947 family protein [Pseudonocardia eucalypti]|uniref:DUF5947 family protein n=1 Tax=Pseudonocardia eucalypti TaxID=648755 RepID=A0ABP9QM29_9PSEU|nr:hypothetical protein [Pseudonocardia eucalypti]
MTRSLRRLLREPRVAPQERCELCATPVGGEHPHLVEVHERRLLCACQACALLFSEPGPKLRYRRVPDRYLVDPEFELSDAQWDALRIPVGMAFFLRNSAREALIACYPSPAGATESELPLEAWADGVGAGPLAAELTPDVEALLVRRGDGVRPECLLVPIDACYRLVGLVRLHWKGFDGGAEAWAAIDAFFDEARSRARTVS